MKQLVTFERICLVGHIVATAFGLAGLVLVLPHPEFILNLPGFGQKAFQWSMAGGGVVYIILGAVAIAIYATRLFGLRRALSFAIPAIVLSASSELIGTSTGFPFGHYQYLSGLGYKIAGLVPFTIPLSWFYMGFTCWILARAGLSAIAAAPWLQKIGGIALGALLLTAWDFVLDPAMSQTTFPFWEFQEAGAFFGMPYRNLSGWLGTGALFMGVATVLWQKTEITLKRAQLNLPLAVYLVNFAFGAVITLTMLDSRFWIPTVLSICLGVLPAFGLWWIARHRHASQTPLSEDEIMETNSASATTVAPVEMVAK
jgi:putative membrane protein